MFRTKLIKACCLAIVLVMVFTTLTACGGNNDKKVEESKSQASSASSTEAVKQPEPLLEYSFYLVSDAPPTYVDESTDVITPEVEKKFNVKVKETLYNQGVSFKERFNLLLASGELPDVINTWGADATTVAASGKYAELGDLIKENMPNYMKISPENLWGDIKYQGKVYSISSVNLALVNDYSNDLYVDPMGNWTYWARESILKKLGYKFTPLKDIEAKTNLTQKKPTIDDFNIEPAIETYDDFYNYLKKIKELGLKVNDKEIIPFTLPPALQIHFGSGYGMTGYWQNNGDKGWNGWLGSENTKDYYKWFNKLFNEQLVDADFLIQKPEQMQEKAASGLVANGMWLPDVNKVRDSLKKLDPEDELRPMLKPREPGKTMPIDHVNPVFFQFLIKKDFKDIPRLLKYFDWFYSDEAQDLGTWGPESTGTWEIKDGKKVFKDDAVIVSLKKGEKDKGTVAYESYYKYGMGAVNKAFFAAPNVLPNMYDYSRSYPYTVTDIYTLAWNTVSQESLDVKGVIKPGFDDITNAPGSYWWTTFSSNKSAQLIAAKDDTEFEKNWNEIYNDFITSSKYEEAKKAFADAQK